MSSYPEGPRGGRSDAAARSRTRQEVVIAIKLSHEATDRLRASIKRYFAENLEQDIGDLKAALLLDFCLKEIGPTIYNQAIADAQSYLQERVVDLDGVCHEQEFAYWSPKPGGRGGKSQSKGDGPKGG